MPNYRRFLALLIALLLLLPSIPARAAQGFSDVEGHWGKAAILRWSGIGVLSGYPDGTFRPDNPVTRGELATIINKLMRFPETPADIELFTDMPADKWYAPNVNALALQGAYLVTHGEAKGDAILTREEAAAMIYNSFPLINVLKERRFTDYEAISDDYAEKISLMQNIGFLSGFPDGGFHPKEPITRAQVLAILNNMITDYITEPGTYETLEGNRVLVAVPGVTLKAPCEYVVISPAAGMGTTYVNGSVTYATSWLRTASSVMLIKKPIHEARQYFHPYDARFAGGFGKEWSPYLIENQTQLALLNEYPDKHNKDIYFALANDITLIGQWTPISLFYGTLDGKDHAAYGLNISHNSGAGLFWQIIGTVRNLTISGDISVDTTYTQVYVGGICGSAISNSVIENCISYVNISLNGTGSIFAGGIAGYVSGNSSVDSCQAYGVIKSATVSIKDGENSLTGGIAGAINNSQVSNSFSNATVTASGGYYSFAGGIVGLLSNSSTMEGCFSSGKIHAQDSLMQNNAGGAVGQIYKSKAIRCGSGAQVSASGNPGYFNAVGGFAGSIYEDGSAANCYSVGAVSCTDGYASIAGFVGRMAGSLENCYTASPINASGALNNYNYQGLVGTVRTSIETANCGVFTGSTLHFYDNVTDPSGRITQLSKSDIQTARTYQTLGWDFDSVWVMPNVSDRYKLPILRGVFEDRQRTLAMPAHLG